MWYFAWLLGLPLAACFAVLNAMWYELVDDAVKAEANRVAEPTADGGIRRNPAGRSSAAAPGL